MAMRMLAVVGLLLGGALGDVAVRRPGSGPLAVRLRPGSERVAGASADVSRGGGKAHYLSARELSAVIARQRAAAMQLDGG